MTESPNKDAFLQKYGNKDKIWSSKSFINHLDLRPLLAELPVSAETGPAKDYEHTYIGELDMVYGELMHNLIAFESYLKDKSSRILECSIKPIIGPEAVSLEFDLHYHNIHYKEDRGEATRTCEVKRTGDRRFILYQ